MTTTTTRQAGTTGRFAMAMGCFMLSLLPAPSVACTLDPGDVVVTDVAAKAVFEIDHQTGEACEIAKGAPLQMPLGVAIDAAGWVLVADADAGDDGNGAVFRIDPSSGTLATLSKGGHFVDPFGLAIGRNGVVYVADPNAFDGTGGVIALDRKTFEQSVVTSGGVLQQPVGVAVAPHGRLLVTDREARAVVRVTIGTGVQKVLATADFTNPIGIATGARGETFVADANAFDLTGGIIQIDPRSGTQKATYKGGMMHAPASVAIAANGRLVVANYDGLVIVDRTSGAQTPMPLPATVTAPWAVAVVD